MKVHRSTFYLLRSRGVSPVVLERLGRDGDRFFRHLEDRWSFDLGDEKIMVSLGAKTGGDPWEHVYDLPEWMTSGYAIETRQSVIQIHDRLEFDYPPLLRSLKIQTVHFLLNRGENRRMPIFLEEGLALFFSRGWSTRDRYRAIGAFRRSGPAASWIDVAKNGGRRGLNSDLQVLSFLFVRWMWKNNPEGVRFFLNRFMSGTSWESALGQAKFGDLDALLGQFEKEQKPNHRLYHIAMTVDFWLVLVGFFFLILSVFWTIRAVQKARKSDLIEDLDAAEPDQELIAELAESPVFGGGADPRKIEPPPPERRHMKPEKKPVLDLHVQEEIDVDVDAFFSAKVASADDEPAKRQLKQAALEIDAEKKVASVKRKKDPLLEPSPDGTDTIERDVDSFFNKIAEPNGSGRDKKQ